MQAAWKSVLLTLTSTRDFSLPAEMCQKMLQWGQKWWCENGCVNMCQWAFRCKRANLLIVMLMYDVVPVVVVTVKGFDAYLTWSSFSVWDLSLHTFTFISAFSSSSCWTLWGEIIHYKVACFKVLKPPHASYTYYCEFSDRRLGTCY